MTDVVYLGDPLRLVVRVRDPITLLPTDADEEFTPTLLDHTGTLTTTHPAVGTYVFVWDDVSPALSPRVIEAEVRFLLGGQPVARIYDIDVRERETTPFTHAVLVPGPNATQIAGQATDVTVALPQPGHAGDCGEAPQLLGYSIPEGFGGALQFQYLDSQGNIIADLPEGATFSAKLQPMICGCQDRVSATVTSPDVQVKGDLRITLPDSVVDYPDVYQLQVAIMQNNRPLQIKTSLVSVEASFFGETTKCRWLTLSDVRARLRDTAGHSAYLAGYTYGSDEVLRSILEPVETWNSMPPFIAPLTAATFPFKTQWLDATVARLLGISALAYLRDGGIVNYTGATYDVRSKAGEYQNLAMAEWDKYLAWVAAQKRTLSYMSGARVIRGVGYGGYR